MAFKRWIVSLLGDEVDLIMWDRLTWLLNNPDGCRLKDDNLCWSVETPTLYFRSAGDDTQALLYASPWGAHLEGTFCFTSMIVERMANQVILRILRNLNAQKDAKLRERFVEALIDGDFVQPDIPQKKV